MSNKVTIYSDGACSGNPGPGGWAALMMYGSVEKAISGGECSTTNNQMELTAAIKALEALTRPCEVDFYTDSQYLRKGITEWIDDWIKRGWLTSKKEPVKNQDLWQRLHSAAQRHTIHWHWVKGHASSRYNQRVDQLAVAEIEKIRRTGETETTHYVHHVEPGGRFWHDDFY